mgnify:FL=1
MIRKQEILEDFWDNFPQYEEMTPTYEDIRFEEEEIIQWNKDWIDSIFKQLEDRFTYEIETIKDLEEYIKLK